MNTNIRQYRVRENVSRALPGRCLFLDTETKVRQMDGEEHHRMDFAWTCFTRTRKDKSKDQEDWRFWNNTLRLQEYIASLARPRTSLFLFAHNVFFDLQVSDFFYYFTRWGWQHKFSYDKGLTYILTIVKDRRTIKCLSTTNFYPATLRELGELLDLPKLDVDFETTPRQELIEYCRRDTEIIKLAIETWMEFIRKHDLGRFSLTRAAQAFNAFRHRFMPKTVTFHRDKELSDFEQKAYHGGRVECGFRGEISNVPMVSLDINSMYPYVMRNREYPTRFEYFRDQPSLNKVERVLDDRCVVAKVWLKTDEPAYAVKRFGQVIFPVGKFSAYVCTEGLRYALEHGHVLAVDQMAVYRKGSIFKDFVDYFYPLKYKYKNAGNPIMEDNTKKILNSLYGKFGQKKPILVEEEDITCDGYWKEEILDLTTGNVITVTKMFNKRWTTEGSEPGRNSMTAIAAHVTEYARFVLWDIINQVGRENVLYCDTDSIKIPERYLCYVKHPIHERKLGALKIEERFDWIRIEAAKQYETPRLRKLKGVPRRAEQLDEYKWKYQEFSGQDTHLRAGVDRWFITKTIEKNTFPVYTKGKTLESGRVIPITLDESLPLYLLS